MTTIIPIAGMGRRTKASGPKSLIPYNNGKTLIEHQIELVRQVFPEGKIIVVVGYEADKIIKVIPEGVGIVENELHHETGVLRSLSIAMRTFVDEDILFINGDILFNVQALTCTKSGKSISILDSSGQMASNKVGANVVNGRITSLAFGVNPKWGQIFYLTGKELALFQSFASDKHKRRFSSYEGLNYVVSKGGVIYGVEPKNILLKEIEYECII